MTKNAENIKSYKFSYRECYNIFGKVNYSVLYYHQKDPNENISIAYSAKKNYNRNS